MHGPPWNGVPALAHPLASVASRRDWRGEFQPLAYLAGKNLQRGEDGRADVALG
jgi:hypothetical protein